MENQETIRVELYDNVLLKDGKTATIIEIYKNSYVADIKTDDGDYDTQFIKIEQIEKIIK